MRLRVLPTRSDPCGYLRCGFGSIATGAVQPGVLGGGYRHARPAGPQPSADWRYADTRGSRGYPGAGKIVISSSPLSVVSMYFFVADVLPIGMCRKNSPALINVQTRALGSAGYYSADARYGVCVSGGHRLTTSPSHSVPDSAGSSG